MAGLRLPVERDDGAEGLRDFSCWIIAAPSGRGHKFETPIYHHFGQAELADQLAGVAWLTQQPYVDGARIGIWGWSYGGYMTCLAMLRAGDVFKAGFAGAPVTDWRQYDTIYTERYMGTPRGKSRGLSRFVAGQLRRRTAGQSADRPRHRRRQRALRQHRRAGREICATPRNTPKFRSTPAAATASATPPRASTSSTA